MEVDGNDQEDCMEIDDSIPETSIIERKSDQFEAPPQENVITESEATNTTQESSEANEAKSSCELNPPEPLPEKPVENTNANEKEKTAAADEDDVVVLDDDDDEDLPKVQPTSSVKNNRSSVAKDIVAVEDIIDLVDKPVNLRCINNNCDGTNTSFFPAPDFCLSYYRVKRSKKNKEEVCQGCYNKSVDNYDELATSLINNKLVLKNDYPIMNETLQIEDSDEEEEEEKENIKWNKTNFKFVCDNLCDIIDETIKKFNGDEILNMETAYVKYESNQLEISQKEVSRKASDLRKFFDQIQLNLYNQFRPELSSLKALSITDDFNVSPTILVKTEPNVELSPRKSSRSHKPVSYVELDDPNNSNSPKVTLSPDVEIPKDLPPVGPVEKIEPKIGEIYYIVRENYKTNWIRARLQSKIPAGGSYNGETYATTHYKLIELKQQKERVVDGKHIAQLHHSRNRLLPVGTRVISIFRECTTEEVKKPRTDPYYAGIVAEQPFEGNKYRYLIFFDIGYSQYVSYLNVNLVHESSTNVWDDVDMDCRMFIKKYLESQDRPMVKLAKDQTIKVEYNGKWLICRVVNVDCSLAQVCFETIKRTEWIYRGSTRLSPMFKEEQAATSRTTGVRMSRKLGPNESATVVQYTRKDENTQSATNSTTTTDSPTPIRAVARKSTTRPQNSTPTASAKPFLPEDVRSTNNTSGPTSKIMYFTPREAHITQKKCKPHTCSPKCKNFQTYEASKLRGHNPLSKPLLCGWGRLTIKSKGRRETLYKAPCARMLRSIAEVHIYLRITKSELTIDLFDFHHNVRCLAEFSVDCHPDPADLSKGMEQTPIPVVNGINREMLDFCNYSIKRVPMEGVDMNLDPEFLCGCDCDDDCIDKTKCACWKLTLEGAKYIGKDISPTSVGYIYRRLPEQVITGIYECNSRCKCSSTCLNRVVQNPMSLKLQVFKTHNRGWGIRCLNDVPPGSFICIYAGTIHTEAMANEDGVAYGDEYFAELDYIETVEKYKEDYEAEVMEEEEEEDKYKRKNPPEEEEEEEEEMKVVISSSKYKRYNYAADNDFTPSHPDRIVAGDPAIRTRLRTRTKEDIKVEKAENETKSKREDMKGDLKAETGIKMKNEQDTTVKSLIEGLSDDIETVTISDEDDEGREVLSFNPKASNLDEKGPAYTSVRELFGAEESVYVMDAKNAGNIGRFLNHSCSPNVFVQNVFVDTHDPRFPWVSFFSLHHIRAGTELTWNYNYDIGSVPGKMLICHCSSGECKGRLL